MPATGLKGIWGLEKLDNTEMENWKLGLFLISGGILIGLVLYLVLGKSPADPSLPVSFTPEFTLRIWPSIGAIIGLEIFMTMVITRYIQTRTESALKDFPQITNFRKYLEPSRTVILICLFLSISIMYSLYLFKFGELFQMGYFDVLQRLGPYYAVGFYGFTFGVALVGGLIYVVIYTGSVYLSHIAREITLDILDIDKYSCLCNMAVILVILISLTYAVIGALILVLELPSYTEFLYWVALIQPLFIIIFFYIAVRPVWLMHKRITKEKKLERMRIKDAINGKIDALNESILIGNIDRLSHAELISFYIIIDFLPEWPLGPNLYKIIFYVLLPPITWVMAAAIDKVIFK